MGVGAGEGEGCGLTWGVARMWGGGRYWEQMTFATNGNHREDEGEIKHD